jgi:hypothetical protein
MEDHVYAVGDEVSYEEWTGRIYKVYPSGHVLIDWLRPWPYPFFRGPYKPHEISRV